MSESEHEVIDAPDAGQPVAEQAPADEGKERYEFDDPGAPADVSEVED